MKKSSKIKRLIIISAVLAGIAAAGIVAENIILGEIRERIRSQIEYSRMYLSAFPPALIIEDARSVSANPFFFAGKITVKISAASLLSQNKPFDVVIENPVIQYYSASKRSDAAGPSGLNVTLPFVIERGLIRNGQIYYWGKDFHFRSPSLNALFTQKKDRFTLYSEINKSFLNWGDEKIQGNLELALSGQGNQIEIKKLRIDGPQGVVKAEGKVAGVANPRFSLKSSFTLNAGLPAGLLRLPFNWEGSIQGRGQFTRTHERIGFTGSLEAPALALNDFLLGKAEAEVKFREGEKNSIEVDIQKPGGSRAEVDIEFDGKRIKGILRAVPLKPVANELELPWPVYSPAWGEFYLTDGLLTADARFRNESSSPRGDLFPLQGGVHVEWDLQKNVEFYSEELISSFAAMELKGGLQIGKNLELTLQGEVRNADQARRFTELLLDTRFNFSEIRGAGSAKLNIFGDPESPQLNAEFTLSPGGFDQFDAAFVEGEAELIENDFFGRFEIEDPDYQGRVALFTHPAETRVNVRIDRGKVETLLPALDIRAPLKGEASGRIEYVQKADETYEFQGTFSGERIRAAGLNLSSIKGNIEGDTNTVAFSEVEFRYWNGDLKGRAFFNIPDARYNVKLEGENLDFSSAPGSLGGFLDISLQGEGILGRDSVDGSYKIRELAVPPFQPARTQGKIKIGYSSQELDIGLDGRFLPGDNPVEINAQIPLNGNILEGQAKGHFGNLDILLPWKGAEGRLNYLIEARGSRSSPRIKGVIDFQGDVLPFPRFAHALRDYSGLIFVENGELSLRSFQGNFGGGPVQGEGSISVDLSGIRSISLRAQGREMTLAPLERSRALADGRLHLIKNSRRFVLEGEFLIDRMLWRRELDEEFAFSSLPYPGSDREPGFFDGLALNIRLRADDNAWLENSLGQIHGKFDLTLAGNVFNPVVLGEIETIEGTVFFQDREFNVIQGRVSFFNPARIEPYLNFKGETYVKDYHVTFSLEGLLEKLNPQFSSSPPLPPEDVLALLALGEAFRRTYHYDRSIGQSTASLLSFQLSEEAKKRAEQLFSIDRFRIDPFIMGTSTEMTARLTLGKKLSRNFFILYSTNLASQREEITRIEWELGNDFSVVGTRDETGRVSFNVKIHKRF